MTLYSHDIPGGSIWSTTVRSGRLVTLTALGQGANLSVLLIGSDRLDRLNIPDTLKAQMSACIRPPMVLMSDRGLALASVAASSLDWHDALAGFAHDQSRSGMSGSGLVIELAKHGLGEADLHGCVNFFSKVDVDDEGALKFRPGYAQTGDTVTLRTEQDLLMIAATTPHPMQEGAIPNPPGVKVNIDFAPWPIATAEPPGFRPETRRALEQTRRECA
jgi:uncharacterized protein YcgI (DUF1989 family)